MRMTKEIKRITLLLMLLISASMVYAQPQLHYLDIQVVLSKNGDARISELRNMTIDGKGSECYIGMDNISPSTIKDLIVSDESGRLYENIGSWDKKRAKLDKAGRCGIVKKDNGGLEICWGVDSSGKHTYVTSYTITGLVRGYADADAICHKFLDKSYKPKPEWARVTIVSADTTLSFTSDTCGIWGFNFKGDTYYVKGALVAMTTEAMKDDAALCVMAKFPKGMLEPTIQITDDTFEHKKQLAVEGRDDAFTEEKKSAGVLLTILKVLGFLAVFAIVLGGLYYLFKKLKK